MNRVFKGGVIALLLFVLLFASSPSFAGAAQGNSVSMQSIAPDETLAALPWPMFRHDPQHTGRSPYSGPQTPIKKWEFATGDMVSSSPAIGSDGTIYIGSLDNKLYALNPNGSKKWEFATGNAVWSSPAIGSDGTVYVGSADSKLYALNPNGSKKWEFATGDMVYSCPTIGSDGTVYVGSFDGKLYALNPNGSKKWEFATGDSVVSSPAIGSDGTVYVGSYDGKLYALNPNGSKKWEFATGDMVYSSPAIGSDGTVYVGSFDGKLYALNPNGSKKWEFATGSSVYSCPAIGSDGTVYVGSYDNKLYAINPNGSKKWEFAAGSYVRSSPAIGSDGTVYVGSADNKLYALNPNGSKKWEFAAGSSVSSSPAIGNDGTVYVGSADSKLYAIGEYTVAYSLQAGWNMISVPLVLANPSPEAVFPAGWPLYSWNAVANAYLGRSQITLAIGKGYWLKAPTSYPLSITGQPNMESSFTISLSQGWNLIGSPYEAAIGWSTVRVHKALVLKNLDDAISAGWIKSPFYRWTGSTYAGLVSGGAFQPKAGYWVKVLVPECTLTFLR